MTLMKLPSYEEMNGGAHRKPASILGAPSIVRHLALWDIDPAERHVWKFRGETTTPAKPPKGYDHQAQRRNKYLNYLNSLHQRICPTSDESHLEQKFRALGKDPSGLGRNSADICKFWWNGLLMTLRLEMEAEYVTFTMILDLSRKGRDHPAAIAGNEAAQKLDRAVQELETAFNQHSKPADGWPALREQLMQEIWKHVDEQLIDPSETFSAELGYVFADFRGLITGTMSDPDRNDGSDAAARLARRFRQPFTNGKAIGSVGKPARAIPPDEWRRDILQQLWPLIQSEHGTDDFEFTASGYLEGRAIFVSALGPQPPTEPGEIETASLEKWAPLHYYLHTDTHDEWQLGRLVNRIHNLATLRLAAIVRIGALTEAAEIAEDVAKLIETADSSLSKALAVASGLSPADRKDLKEEEQRAATPAAKLAIDAKRKGAADVREKAMLKADADITAIQTKLKGINDLFPADIMARLERSQQYVERFMNGADIFRVERIEGFQVYKEFVSRRMNGLFSSIDLLHKRMNDIRKGMSQIQRKYANLKITTATCEIKELTSSINRENDEIRKIQDFGEIALIGILVPYYLGYLIIHAFAGNLYGMNAKYWALVTGICASVAAIMLWRQRKKNKDLNSSGAQYTNKQLWFLVFFIALVAGLVIFSFALPIQEMKGKE